MGSAAVYQIERSREGSGPSELVERLQIISEGGQLQLCDSLGVVTSASEADVSSLVASTPALHEIRTGETTSITGEPALIEQLPFLLKVVSNPANPNDHNGWAEVNGDDWGEYKTSDGYRMLPCSGSEDEPSIDPTWLHMSFIETGSRTSGYFRGSLGLITAAVVADMNDPDEDPIQLTLKRRGDDAAMVVDWLLGGLMVRDFWGDGDAEGRALMAQLFVEATCGAEPGAHIDGMKLAAGVTPYEDTFGSSISAEWTLSVSLDQEVIDRVLELLSDLNPRIADIVTAGKEPDSPQGRARAEALQEVIDTYYT